MSLDIEIQRWFVGRAWLIVGIGTMGIVAGALPGCQPATSRQSPERLLPADRFYFTDLPIPQGFTISETLSEDRLTGRRRIYVRHVYQGKGDSYAVRNFFMEQMPQHQWQMVHSGNVEGVHTLRFEKADESCTITLRRPGSGWGPSLQIEVMLMQEEKGSQPYEPKPRS